MDSPPKDLSELSFRWTVARSGEHALAMGGEFSLAENKPGKGLWRVKGLPILAALLAVLGVAAFTITGGASWTALIPTVFGALIGVLALAAQRRSHPHRWNIAAVAVTLVGLAGSSGGFLQLPALMTGGDVARPAAAVTQVAMGLLCLGFLIPMIAGLSSGTISRLPSRTER